VVIITRVWAGHPRNHGSIPRSQKVIFYLIQKFLRVSAAQPGSYCKGTDGAILEAKAIGL
jgi:hypothetical protein